MADRIIAVRTGKTVYRDGDTAVKVFDADYAKPEIGRASCRERVFRAV